MARFALAAGLFVLEPNLAEYKRALHHLYHELNIKRTTDRAGRVRVPVVARRGSPNRNATRGPRRARVVFGVWE